MSSSVGLMIGLSLSDRNMRRLLDAISKTPLIPENYALLQKPRKEAPSEEDIYTINKKAEEYFDKFQNSGNKTDHQQQQDIPKIIDRVEEKDEEAQIEVLRKLGVEPVWYVEHSEIPSIINEIISGG